MGKSFYKAKSHPGWDRFVEGDLDKCPRKPGTDPERAADKSNASEMYIAETVTKRDMNTYLPVACTLPVR